MSDDIRDSREAVILLVEDNEDDVILMKQGFKRSKLLVDLHHVKDGIECMEFLHQEGEYADAPRPDLILLDLNMPRMDGREVLDSIVKDENLRYIPVVILTTSRNPAEIREMYELRCSSYIVKPVDFEQFQRVVQLIGDYWFTVVVLPGSQSGS